MDTGCAFVVLRCREAAPGPAACQPQGSRPCTIAPQNRETERCRVSGDDDIDIRQALAVGWRTLPMQLVWAWLGCGGWNERMTGMHARARHGAAAHDQLVVPHRAGPEKKKKKWKMCDERTAWKQHARTADAHDMTSSVQPEDPAAFLEGNAPLSAAVEHHCHCRACHADAAPPPPPPACHPARPAFLSCAVLTAAHTRSLPSRPGRRGHFRELCCRLHPGTAAA